MAKIPNRQIALIKKAENEATFELLKQIGVFGNPSDKGDIIVSKNGATWTIKKDVIKKFGLTQAQIDIINNTSGVNTGDNAVNTTSNTYADGKVADVINDGVTDIAPSQNAVFDALALKESLSNKGASNGYVPLNVNSLIDQVYLPSYVDDIIEGIWINSTTFNVSGSPITLEVGKIYVSTDSGKQYRYSGSILIQITNGLISSTSDVPDSADRRYVTDLQLLSFVPISGILPYAGSSSPSGYLLCDGSAVSRTTYAALFAVIGTTYGAGDGGTTFNIPDLRQRFPLGKAASGTGSTLGGTGGTIDHVHSIDPPITTTSTPSANQTAATPVLGSVPSTAHTHTVDIPAFNSTSANPPFISVNYIIKT